MNIDGLTIRRAERCPCCGQRIWQPLDEIDDPVCREIIEILRRVGGHVPMRVILAQLPFRLSRWTVYDRLKELEADGIVDRDPDHPRIGWHFIHEQADAKELLRAA